MTAKNRIKKSKPSYRRLTSKQYKSLMDKAAVELGINNNKTYKILDLDKADDVAIKPQQAIDKILATVSRTHPKILSAYEETIKGRRLKGVDKWATLAWLLCPEMSEMPLYLLPEKEKRRNRKKKRDIGLKARGDIVCPPERMDFDEEFLSEVSRNTKRKAFDKFDKMPLDTKIEWARAAKQILGDTSPYLANNVLEPFSMPVKSYLSERELITFAMKYACKVCNIGTFRGRFAKLYWIIHRVNVFSEQVMEKEHKAFMSLLLKETYVSKKKGGRPLSIIDAPKAIQKVIPTLKQKGLYKEYTAWRKTSRYKQFPNFPSYCLKKMTDLLTGTNMIREEEVRGDKSFVAGRIS